MSLSEKFRKYKVSRSAQLERFNTKVWRGGNLSTMLIDDSLCEEIQDNKIVKIVKKLGKGVFGTAYLVHIEGMGEKEFALKEVISKLEIEYIVVNKNRRTYDQIGDYIQEKYYIPKNIFFKLNSVTDPSKKPEIILTRTTMEVKVLLPENLKQCHSLKELYHPLTETTTKVPKGSWICENYDPLGDFYFGELCSSLYLTGQSINFLPVFGYSTCSTADKKAVDDSSILDNILENVIRDAEESLTSEIYMTKDKQLTMKISDELDQLEDDKEKIEKMTPADKIDLLEYYMNLIKKYPSGKDYSLSKTSLSHLRGMRDQGMSSYILMQKIDGELAKFFNAFKFGANFDKKSLHAFYIQLLHSIAMMQERYKMNHGDLHSRNIFIEVVSDKKAMFNGQNLNKADYYHYHAYGNDFYFEAVPFIVKIGDFGLSRQFTSDRIVMSNWVNDEASQPGGDPLGFFINWFSTSYDVLYSFYSIMKQLDLLSFDDKCTKMIYDKVLFRKNERHDLNSFDENFVSRTLRPTNQFVVDKDKEGFGPLSLLTPEIFEEYTKRPPSNKKVVTLGRL